MNHFTTCGRLSSDPEVRWSRDGKTCIVHFSFAVQRRFAREGEPTADFFRCVCFGKTAELFEKCGIRKGTKLLLSGEMHNNNYEKNGQMVYGFEFAVTELEFCEKKSEGGARTSVPASGPAGAEGFMAIPDAIEDEGLPFM